MKRLLILLALPLLFITKTSAQECSDSTIVTKHYRNGILEITPEDTIFIIKRDGIVLICYDGEKAIKKANNSVPIKNTKNWKWNRGHWSGVTMNFNRLIGSLSSTSLPDDARWLDQSGKSIGLELNFIDVALYGRGCFGIISGFGMEVNNFRLSNAIGIDKDPVTGVITPNETQYVDSNWKKTKITTSYFQIPLLVEFQFIKNKHNEYSFFANFGVVGSICFESHYKIKSGDYGITKNHLGDSVPLLRYGYEMNLGYGSVGIKAKYYPESIFSDGMGPEVSQFNIGINILL